MGVNYHGILVKSRKKGKRNFATFREFRMARVNDWQNAEILERMRNHSARSSCKCIMARFSNLKRGISHSSQKFLGGEFRFSARHAPCEGQVTTAGVIPR